MLAIIQRPLGLFLLSLFSIGLSAQISLSGEPDLADTLERPVRVLWVGISRGLIEEARQRSSGTKIEYFHDSKALSDYDRLVVFVDEYEQLFEVELVSQIGIKRDALPSPGGLPLFIVSTVTFKDDDFPFVILTVNRRKFYARDYGCHAALLNDAILHTDWEKPFDYANYSSYTRCGN